MNRVPTPADRLPVFDAALGCYRVPMPAGQFALIDAADVPIAASRRWSIAWSLRKDRKDLRYPRVIHDDRNAPGGRHHVRLDRLVTGATEKQRVIHLNDDQLDCRRENLRVTDTATEGQRHRKKRKTMSSRFKGVCWDSRRDRWIATIKIVAGRTRFLGRFDDEERAAEAYDRAAAESFGEFAELNFPHQEAA